MPTVTLDKKKVLELIGKNVPDEALKDRIAMIGTDLETLDDKEITVEVFPNRPDMLSEEGFARALSSFMGIKTGLKEYDVKNENSKVTVKGLPKEWPYAVCAIVRNLKFDDKKIRSIMQLQEKLGVTLLRKRKKGGIGLYPLDKISLPVTFTSYPKDKIAFRPLEGKEPMPAEKILESHPKGREYGHIISAWPRYPVFVDAKGTIMSMPPIINSHDVGKIKESTKDVFVEATGTDLNTLKTAINIILATLADMAGKIYALEMDYGTSRFLFPDFSPRKIKISRQYAEKLLGIPLGEEDIKKLLGRMGMGYEKGNALVPAYRADVLHQMDIVEDIAIAYGYENFKDTIPKVATIAGESKKAILERKTAEVMAGFGFLECKSYHITSGPALGEKMMLEEKKALKPENPANIEYDTLRDNLLSGLMKILSENTHTGYPQNLFEIGDVMLHDSKTETTTREDMHLSCVIADFDSEFSKIRAILEGLINSLGISCTFKESKNPSFIDGRVAEVRHKGKKIGSVGEIHPQVLNNWNLEVPVSAFEIDMTCFFE